MKKPEPGIWQRTSPLAIIFFLGKLARDILKNAWQSLAPLAAFVLVGDNAIQRLKIGGTVFLIVVLAISLLRYWFFRFQLAGDSILIRDGVIKKKQLDIKFDRIQGVNTRQNIVYRYFGLVTVSFDTAGSTGNEGNLPAVPREFAHSLRERIGRTPGREPEDAVEDEEAPPLLQLGWRDMIKIGLSDKRALIVFAVLGPVMERLGDQADNIIMDYIDNAAQEALQFGVLAGVFIVVGIGACVLLVLALISIGAAFWRYHDFELRLDDTRLRSVGGLLTRHEVSMGLGKIQTLRLEQGLILRAFSRFRMTARQARSGQQGESSKDFTVPLVTADEGTALRRQFLDQEGRGLTQIPTSNRFSPVSPYFMRMPLLAHTVASILVTAVAFVLSGDRATLFALLWIPVSMFFVYKTWRHAGYLYTDEGFVRRSGTIGYRAVALLYRKVQRVSVSQTPLQRRKNLATLRVYMASGSVKLPYIDHALATQLRDYILYKVESSQRAWH